MNVTVLLDACTPESVYELAGHMDYPSVTIRLTGERRATFAGVAVEVSGELQDVVRCVADNWSQDANAEDVARLMDLPIAVVRAVASSYGLELQEAPMTKLDLQRHLALEHGVDNITLTGTAFGVRSFPEPSLQDLQRMHQERPHHAH